MTVYAASVWLFWFLTWSSKVYNGKLWRKGFAGITGLHKIDWSGQIVLVTGGERSSCSAFFRTDN